MTTAALNAHGAGTGMDDDLAILRRYAMESDAQAFETIVARYGQMVLATCRRSLANDADAEEAAQETFLKLARHAGKVRSNAAAWLHACAMRTSVDMIRRGSVRRQAEETKASQAGAAPAESPELSWNQMEPLIDGVLAKMKEADRDVIVACFLSGRPRSEVAEELGINPGTLSRRLDKSLSKLRRGLKSAGVEIGAGVALTAALSLAVEHVAAPGFLSASAGKLALAGHATSLPAAGLALGGGSGFLGSKFGPWLLVGAATLTLTGGAFMLASSGGAGGFMSAGASVGTAPKQPRKPVDGGTLFSTSVLANHNQTLVASGDELDFAISIGWGSDLNTMRWRIESVQPARRGNKGTLKLTLLETDAGDDTGYPALIGKQVEGDYRIDSAGRLHLNATIETPGGTITEEWTGTRPPRGHALNPRGAESFDGGTTGFEGPWVELSNWNLEVDAENVTILSDGYKVHRFRVFEWERVKGHARITGIIADSMAPGLVGERVKLLLREDENGYSIAFHEADWFKINQWPEADGGGDPFLARPETGVIVREFRRGD